MKQSTFATISAAACVTAIFFGLPVLQAEAQPTYGCLTAGTCGPNGPANTPDDFWHNWICTECHAAPRTGLSASREERALLASWARFKPVHEAMAPVAKSRRSGTLKPEGEISAEARRLLAEMRGGTMNPSSSRQTPTTSGRTIPPATQSRQ